MKCPNCIAVDLLMSERKGIEIDYCPSCRGVWLDRGELDKFIQQADQQAQVLASERAPSAEWSHGTFAPRNEKDDDDNRRDDDRKYEERKFRDDDRQHSRHGKKKESFWGNLFDFD